MESGLVFYALAGLVTLCSIGVVVIRHPVTAAVALVVNLFLLAGIFATMGAEFVAAIQVIIYAGAIVVLFMFVIMLLNLDAKSLLFGRKRGFFDYFTMSVVVIGFALMGAKILSTALTFNSTPVSFDDDNTFNVAMHLFTGYLWPFELASILILLAVVAVAIIVRKDKATKPSR